MLSVAQVCSNARLAVRILSPGHVIAHRHVRGMTVTSAVAAKRKMVKVGTHNGTFHCDEALGCFLLQQTPDYKETDIVRSRSPDVLKDLDIVIDVGGVYDPSASLSMMHVSSAGTHKALAYRESLQKLVSAGMQRYDHHQRGFEEVFGHGKLYDSML